MRHPAALVLLLVLTGCAVRPVDPLTGAMSGESGGSTLAAEDRGAAYARANCADCHAVGLAGESPLPAAPQFRDLGRRYPVDDLAEAFAEGINTGHAAMPEFVMSTAENSDLIAYLKSIQTLSGN
ncbi:hypothetical protein MMB232_00705 [Brevundimonas subvibrioides]|uniref:c-type cytochrome n=1 Tax=Brevundimonas subvibrioides TaxID=74313 RepID=UPI0032D580CE